jgi:excisionase family DNA binding protein
MSQEEAERMIEGGLLRVSELAAWGISKSEGYRLMAAGRLPFVQRGTRRLISRAAVVRLLAGDLAATAAGAKPADAVNEA